LYSQKKTQLSIINYQLKKGLPRRCVRQAPFCMLYAHKGATHNVSVMSDATTNMHDSLSFLIWISFIGANIQLF